MVSYEFMRKENASAMLTNITFSSNNIMKKENKQAILDNSQTKGYI
jgi:hypothetical protein